MFDVGEPFLCLGCCLAWAWGADPCSGWDGLGSERCLVLMALIGAFAEALMCIILGDLLVRGQANNTRYKAASFPAGQPLNLLMPVGQHMTFWSGKTCVTAQIHADFVVRSHVAKNNSRVLPGARLCMMF